VDDDATIVIRGANLRQRRFALAALLGGAALAAGAGGSWALLHGRRNYAIAERSESQIDAEEPCETKLAYLSLSPYVVVIDFPSLAAQGQTLDRVAAFVEKAGTPRNRVLDDQELLAAILQSGARPDTYYYGHDYRAADLARFFTLADAEGIKLNSWEQWLHGLLLQAGWLRPGARGAIISLAAAGGMLSADMRPVILHHEISHGAFFTEPAYRAYAENFWFTLSADARGKFTGFLGRSGYDTANTELLLNETQAYLVFTRDPRFFNAPAAEMSEAQVAGLRDAFIAGMPDCWLKPLANAALPLSAPARSCSAQTASLDLPLCACARGRRFSAFS
jgi:hypothetical protein